MYLPTFFKLQSKTTKMRTTCALSWQLEKKWDRKKNLSCFQMIFMVLMAIIYKENQSGIVVNKKKWIFQIFPLVKNWGQSIIMPKVMPQNNLKLLCSYWFFMGFILFIISAYQTKWHIYLRNKISQIFRIGDSRGFRIGDRTP